LNNKDQTIKDNFQLYSVVYDNEKPNKSIVAEDDFKWLVEQVGYFKWLIEKAERREQIGIKNKRINNLISLSDNEIYDLKLLLNSMQEVLKRINRYEKALREISAFNNDEMYKGKEFVYIARQALNNIKM
jgi:hypothetical protein